MRLYVLIYFLCYDNNFWGTQKSREIWVPFYFKMLKIRMYLEKLIVHGVLGWVILDKIPELWSLIKGRRVSSHTVWYLKCPASGGHLHSVDEKYKSVISILSMYIYIIIYKRSQREGMPSKGKIHVAIAYFCLSLWENTARRKKGPGFLKQRESVSDTV